MSEESKALVRRYYESDQIFLERGKTDGRVSSWC